VLDVPYHEVVADPLAQSHRIAAFLELAAAHAPAMAAAVDRALYRNRQG
jgi:hypothetical protein